MIVITYFVTIMASIINHIYVICYKQREQIKLCRGRTEWRSYLIIDSEVLGKIVLSA